MHKYGESKTTQIMMAAVPHVTAWAGHTKYEADGVLFDWVYICDELYETEIQTLCIGRKEHGTFSRNSLTDWV